MKGLLGLVLYVGFMLAFIYGVYWIGKTISYKVFYEDMVRGTITEMVKPEALK